MLCRSFRFRSGFLISLPLSTPVHLILSPSTKKSIQSIHQPCAFTLVQPTIIFTWMTMTMSRDPNTSFPILLISKCYHHPASHSSLKPSSLSPQPQILQTLPLAFTVCHSFQNAYFALFPQTRPKSCIGFVTHRFLFSVPCLMFCLICDMSALMFSRD